MAISQAGQSCFRQRYSLSKGKIAGSAMLNVPAERGKERHSKAGRYHAKDGLHFACLLTSLGLNPASLQL